MAAEGERLPENLPEKPGNRGAYQVKISEQRFSPNFEAKSHLLSQISNIVQELTDRLRTLDPSIRQICKVSGTPGASIGILQNGIPIYTANFGYRNVAAKLPPNEHTIYHMASLAKSFSAFAVSSLVSEGKLKWETPIVDILPEFHLQDKVLGPKVTVVDLLAHRLGIASGNALWSQGGNRNHIGKSEILRVIGSRPQVRAFRDSFLYHNLVYAVIAELVERLSSKSYGTYISEKILEPLNMKRTVIKVTQPEPNNRAKAYMPMDDHSFTEIPFPESQDGTIQAASGGIRSCVRDLLTYYHAILQARRRKASGTSDADSSALEQATMVTAAHNLIGKPSMKKSYSLGLLRVELPGTMGDIGSNPSLLKSMPMIGKRGSSQLVIFGQGSYPGFLSSAILLEDPETVIVVLTNSLALNDAAEWIGQLILEEVLDISKKTDFVALAEKSASSYLSKFAEAEKKMAAQPDPDATPKPLQHYVGDYHNSLHNSFIRVVLTNDRLSMCFQGEECDVYNLDAHNNNTFSWYIPREEQARRGRWPLYDEEYFKFYFFEGTQGKISHLTWAMDPAVSSGEIFIKEPLAVAEFKGVKLL